MKPPIGLLFFVFQLYYKIIQNFHIWDFDPLPYSQVIGEKVSLLCTKLWFSMIFSKTICDLKIPNMEVLDTYIRNLYANINTPSFEAALPPDFFSCFYMLGRMRILLLNEQNSFKFDIKQKVI